MSTAGKLTCPRDRQIRMADAAGGQTRLGTKWPRACGSKQAVGSTDAVSGDPNSRDSRGTTVLAPGSAAGNAAAPGQNPHRVVSDVTRASYNLLERPRRDRYLGDRQHHLR